MINNLLFDASVPLILLTVFFCSAHSQAAAQDAEPVSGLVNGIMHFKDTVHDFGTVYTKTTLARSFFFTVRCPPTDTLKILKTASPCGCTIGKIPKKAFINGDTGAIGIEYTTDAVEGGFERTFVIETNSSVAPKISLWIRGTVERGVTIHPPVIDLGNSQIGEKWNCLVRIVWKRPEPLRCVSMSVPVFLRAGKPAQDRRDSLQWFVGVELSGKAESRYYSDTIGIKTTSVLWPEIRLPVIGRPGDVVSAVPSSLSMPHPDSGVVTTMPLLLIASRPIKRIIEARCADSLVRVGSPERLDGKRFRISVSIKGTGRKELLSSDVVITAEAGKRYRIVVPVKSVE